MQEMPETWVQSLGRDDPLEEGTGGPLQYSRLENPMDRGTWGLQSMGLPRVGHDWGTYHSTQHCLFPKPVHLLLSHAHAQLISLFRMLCSPFLSKVLSMTSQGPLQQLWLLPWPARPGGGTAWWSQAVSVTAGCDSLQGWCRPLPEGPRRHPPAGLRLMLTARRNPAPGKRPQCRQQRGRTQRWSRDSWDLRANYFSQ